MRLIDADELTRRIEQSYLTEGEKRLFSVKVRHMPTVAERPQGEWIYPEKTDKEKGYGGYCSNCKCDMPIFVEDWKQKYCETKFCPNCGADMRKGGAE